MRNTQVINFSLSDGHACSLSLVYIYGKKNPPTTRFSMKRLGKSNKPLPGRVVQANDMFASMQRRAKHEEHLRELHNKLLKDFPDSLSWEEWTYEGWQNKPDAPAWKFERYSHQTPEIWDMLGEYAVTTWYRSRDTTAELTYTREDARYKYRLHIYMTKPFSFSASEERPGRLLLCSDWCADFTVTRWEDAIFEKKSPAPPTQTSVTETV